MTISLPESGGFADGINPVTATVPLSETGTGADALAVPNITGNLPDSGTFADAIGTTKSLVPLSDSGQFADFIGAQPSALSIAAQTFTPFYWDINGTPLSTYAYAVKSVGGSRLAPPPMRGENQKIPHMPGQRFLSKVPDARTITLEMWVIGATPDGRIANEAQFDYNWRQLVNLFYNPGVEFTLTKRFRTANNDSVTTAVGRAQYQGGLNPNMTGRTRAEFTVDLFMADPFFYGPPVQVNFGPLPSTNTSQSFIVPGDYSTRAIQFDVQGPATAPQWTYETPTQATWARYNAAVAGGDSVHIDVQNFKATPTVSGVQQRGSGYMQYGGSYFWMEIQPGLATVTYTAQAGTGTSTLTYQPVYW